MKNKEIKERHQRGNLQLRVEYESIKKAMKKDKKKEMNIKNGNLFFLRILKRKQ